MKIERLYEKHMSMSTSMTLEYKIVGGREGGGRREEGGRGEGGGVVKGCRKACRRG